MTDFQINDGILWREAQTLAQEIFDEHIQEQGRDEPDMGEMSGRAHEYADGHEWVIYTYKALQLCANCDTTEGEALLYDCGGIEAGDTFGGIATKIAFGTLLRDIESALSDLIDAYDPDAETA